MTKQQMNAVADGTSLRAALAAEDSHQMYLVNAPESKAIAQRWLGSMLTKAKPPIAKL